MNINLQNFATSMSDNTTVSDSVNEALGYDTTETKESDTIDTQTTGIFSILIWLVAFFILNFVEDKEGVEEQLKPRNIKANFYNLFIIGMSATLFMNVYKILTAKLLVAKSGVLNSIGKWLAPLSME